MAILRISNDGGQTWTPFTVGRQGPAGPQGPAGADGPPGGSVRINGSVVTSSQLPLDAVVGDGYITEDEGHLWVKIAEPNSWQDVGLIRGPQGIPGEITLAIGDARYVKASAGTWTAGKAVTPLSLKAPSGNHGAALEVVSTTVPVKISPVDAAGNAHANALQFDAADEQWEVGKTAVGGPLSADSLTLSGKATSAATVIGDASTTLATKGYVDAALPTGAIIAYGGSSAPDGWALCDGAPHGSSALNTLLGSANTPDLRGRFILAAGQGAGNDSQGNAMVNRVHGDKSGAQRVTLSTLEMPSHQHGANTGYAGTHSHTFSGQTGNGGAHAHGGNYRSNFIHYRTFATGGSQIAVLGQTVDFLYQTLPSDGDHWHYFSGTTSTQPDHRHSISAEGGSASHENMPPFYVLTYIIKK